MKRPSIRKLLNLDTDAGRQNWDDRLALATGAFAAAIIVGALVGAVAMFVRMYQHGTVPADVNPLRVVFASRLMIAATRLALLFVGVYIAVSILVHMRRGQWLTAAGPLKVSDAVRTLEDNVSQQEEQLQISQGEATLLRAQVADLSRQLATAEKLLEQARTQLATKP